MWIGLQPRLREGARNAKYRTISFTGPSVAVVAKTRVDRIAVGMNAISLSADRDHQGERERPNLGARKNHVRLRVGSIEVKEEILTSTWESVWH